MKISGFLLEGEESVKAIFEGMFCKKDRTTSTLANSEEKNKYTAPTSKDAEIYKKGSRLVNEILTSKIGD